MSYSQVLRTPDEYVTNYIYTYNPFSKADDRITLISIDSDTTDKYGDYSNWDRSLLSEAVDILSDNDAAAIALDVDLSENKTTEGDAALVSSCREAGNVIAIADASIMAWNGTLDKFIGDAAMAIFNAPDDLDDYIFSAVCAADDIMKGFIPIRNNFRKKFNRDINLGIGINSGDAIVGNIGCYGRYDYTAIGDTVNTASRLESNAKPGQILIRTTGLTATNNTGAVF